MAGYAFFLGCVMPMRYPGIESATRAVFEELGVELKDMPGASCCPAPGVTHSFDQKTWLAVGARNLAIAEQQGVDILTVCNGCFGSLFDIAHHLKHDPKALEEANKVLAEIGMKYSGNVNVRHFAEVLHNEVGVEEIKKHVKQPLKLKAAIHYGCHFLKPSDIKGIDDPERPRMLDTLVEAVGPKSLDYKDKQMCCGAGGGVRAREGDVARKMTQEKLDIINQAGGDLIVDVCPFCHLQYDISQKELGGAEAGYNTPVVHLSQLYALAFGVDKNKLGFNAQAVKVEL